MIDEKIFKSYDIRGIYPAQLNEEAAYAIGRAFARTVGVKKIALGSDMRLSGPALRTQLIAGITDEGVDVVDFGLVPIDLIYFATSRLGFRAGVMITASHNPKEYNGFKMVKFDALMIGGEAILEAVKQLPAEISEKKGIVSQRDGWAEYIDHVLTFVDLKKIKPFRVVVDAGSGMAGKVIPLLEKYLPIKITPLNFALDGNFPAHPSNPLLPESQAGIAAEIKKQQADFGVIFDGDTDRLIFLDEQGQFIQADITLLILAKEFLSREPGAGIVYNAVCSRAVPEFVEKMGGRPIRSRVGYFFVTQARRAEKGIMGGELSSHYSFRDNSYADSGFISFLILLQLLSEDGRPLSKIIAEFQVYHKSDEINLEVSDWKKIITLAKDKYRDGQQDELDGLTVQYDQWWFNIRPSNTEPLLRLTVEAQTMPLLKEKVAEISKLIKANA